MIYWFTGQPGAGKTILGKRLKDLLINKRNVFHIDGDDLREMTLNKDYSENGRIQNIKNAQLLAYFLQNNKCDVIVSLVSPYKNLRDEFKNICGDDIVEIYVHTNDERDREEFKVNEYEAPIENFFDIDTTIDNPTQSFNRLIDYLKEINKL